MTDKAPEVLEFRPPTGRQATGVTWVHAVAAVAIVLPYAWFITRAQPGAPTIDAFLAVAFTIAFFTMVALKQRYDRAVKYALTSDGVEQHLRKGLVIILYPDITRLVIVGKPSRPRGLVLLYTRYGHYVFDVEHRARFVEEVYKRAGSHIITDVQPTAHLRPLFFVAALVAVVMMLLLTSTMPMRSIITPIAFASVYALLGLITWRGWPELFPDPGDSRKRLGLGITWVLIGLLVWGRWALEWRHSFLRAVETSLFARPLAEGATIRDFEGLSFGAPAGWKVGTSHADSCTWLVMRKRSIDGESLTVVVSARSFLGVPDRALYGAIGPSVSTGETASTLVTIARISYVGDSGETPTVYAVDPAFSPWHAFEADAILSEDGLTTTYWRTIGSNTVTVTVEKGPPESPEVIELLKSLDKAASSLPAPVIPSPCPASP